MRGGCINYRSPDNNLRIHETSNEYQGNGFFSLADQSFKPITTRTFYPGRHHAELVINGVSCAKRSFDLLA